MKKYAKAKKDSQKNVCQKLKTLVQMQTTVLTRQLDLERGVRNSSACGSSWIILPRLKVSVRKMFV
jgi:hypothetical protein